MNDVYRTADPKPMWSVTYRHRCPKPFEWIVCTDVGILARDEAEAIEIATRGEKDPWDLVDVHKMGVPSNGTDTQEK